MLKKNLLMKTAIVSFLLFSSSPALAAVCAKVSDINTFLDWIKCTAIGVGDTTRYVAALVGLIFCVGGVIAWKVAGSTNDPSKTKGSAATSFVVGLVLVGIMAWIGVFGNVTTENENMLEDWSTEWDSGGGAASTPAP